MKKSELMYLLSKVPDDPKIMLGIGTNSDLDVELTPDDIGIGDVVFIVFPESIIQNKE